MQAEKVFLINNKHIFNESSKFRRGFMYNLKKSKIIKNRDRDIWLKQEGWTFKLCIGGSCWNWYIIFKNQFYDKMWMFETILKNKSSNLKMKKN
jgi:hypothetical protein